MTIKNSTPYYFYFAFSEEELKAPAARRMLEAIKTKMKFKEYYYIAEKKHWEIRKDKFLEFIAILAEYLNDVVNVQEGMF
jgi:hypothetical protein